MTTTAPATDPATATPPVDAVAYYLPQFYPIALNSTWWGEGFTEWNSLVTAQRGTRSPRRTLVTPSELGFYDLRSREVRERQGELARLAGLSALCIWSYYSAGERVLAEVEDRILADGAPDFPFMLGWANHDWTLAWKGRPDTVILEQAYDEHLSDRHIEALLDALEDPRYYRIGGRPALLVYAPLRVPDHRRVFDHWRDLAVARGHDGLFLLGNAFDHHVPPPERVGIDAWVQGTSVAFGAMANAERALRSLATPARATRYLRHRDLFMSYARLLEIIEGRFALFPRPTAPVVVTSWNNTGRRARRASYTDSTPQKYRLALERACSRAPTLGVGSEARRLVTINAWNEWGEGMTMEPSVEHGTMMIDVTRSVLGAHRADVPVAGGPHQ